MFSLQEAVRCVATQRRWHLSPRRLCEATHHPNGMGSSGERSTFRRREEGEAVIPDIASSASFVHVGARVLRDVQTRAEGRVQLKTGERSSNAAWH